MLLVDFFANSVPSEQSDPSLISSELREKLERVWDTFGWSDVDGLSGLVESHPQEVAFLYKCKLPFAIHGYQNSLKFSQDQYGHVLTPQEEALFQGIKLDDNAHPMILKEGEWVRCSDLQNLVKLDPVRKIIISVDNPDDHWQYNYPDGLVRLNPREVISTHRISPPEIAKLQEITESPGHRRFFQIFTNLKPGSGSLSHVGCRLIKPNGDVISVGFGTVEGEASCDLTNLLTALSTQNARIYCPDFEELIPVSERKVTTLAVSDEQFSGLMQRIETYARAYLRFQFMRQNCAKLGDDCLKYLGEDPGAIRTPSQFFLDLVPENFVENTPYIGSLYVRVRDLVKPIFSFISRMAPNFVKKFFESTITVLLFIPNKILVAIRNILFMIFGATRAPFELRGNPVENTIDNSDHLTCFNQFMSWKDLFNEEIGLTCSSYSLAKWQDTQSSTFTVHGENTGPRFHVAPPPDIAPPVA